ncbi:hypothetical protein [Dysgonomonas sp. ZJ279]|uniref:hypothetical protein n=1 Tax=Dysgonomonas sp. ZJ279 TaxID=2709796 RepID=UPI0013EA8460|nr:hypothetical protein [Dysgonomonas sp. ZJ279]
MRTKIIILILGSLLLSCSSSKPIQETVKIEQVETDLPIIIRGDTANNRVFNIQFPFSFKANNYSHKTVYINYIHYYFCNDYGKTYLGEYGAGWLANFFVYQYKKDGNLILQSAPLKMGINKSQHLEFIVEPSYDIDTTTKTQVALRPYIEQMKVLRVKKIAIGTYKEFREKHPELAETLLKGDSVSFVIFKDLDKNNAYDESNSVLISQPIKY